MLLFSEEHVVSNKKSRDLFNESSWISKRSFSMTEGLLHISINSFAMQF